MKRLTRPTHRVVLRVLVCVHRVDLAEDRHGLLFLSVSQQELGTLRQEVEQDGDREGWQGADHEEHAPRVVDEPGTVVPDTAGDDKPGQTCEECEEEDET